MTLTLAPRPPLARFLMRSLRRGSSQPESTASKMGVRPALSAISMAEARSRPCSRRAWRTVRWFFSMAWWRTEAPELSYFKGDAPLSNKYLTNSWYPPLALYIKGVHPLGLGSSIPALALSSSNLHSLRSPLMAAQLRGVRPRWSRWSTSRVSGVWPAKEDSTIRRARSWWPWMQQMSRGVCPCSS